MDIDSIDELVTRYSDEGNPEVAIAQQDIHTFSLMRQFQDGLPTIVTLNALDKGIDYVAQFLAQMIVDTRAELEQWDDAQRREQMYLTRVFMRLLRGEGWVDALTEAMPSSEGTEES